MGNVVVILLLAAMVGAIVCYLYRAKKRGQTCIGCPNSDKCTGKCGGECGHK
jgi:hypothetical protein